MYVVLRKVMKNSEKDNKLLSKTQQRFKSEKCNVFTEEINKIALSSNGDKTIQSIDSILIASKDLVCKKGEVECDDIIKQYKND